MLNSFKRNHDETIKFLKNTYGKVTFVIDESIYGTSLFNKIKNSLNVIKEDKYHELSRLYVDLNQKRITFVILLFCFIII